MVIKWIFGDLLSIYCYLGLKNFSVPQPIIKDHPVRIPVRNAFSHEELRCQYKFIILKTFFFTSSWLSNIQ